MSDHKSNQVIVPEIPRDGDSRDSSLIVYTITVAIAIALFALTLTMPDSNIRFKLINLLCTAFLAISTILTFISIEYLVDITSFAYSESNTNKDIRKKKYLLVLRLYNLAIVLIITSILLILSNYFLALTFINNYCLNNIYIKISLYVLFAIVWVVSTRKWWLDLLYLSKVD